MTTTRKSTGGENYRSPRRPTASILAVACVMLISCSSVHDVTSNPARWTDFVVGQTYTLKQPVYQRNGSLGRFSDQRSEEAYRIKKPSGVDAVLDAGTPMVIRLVEVFRAPKVGKWTDVYAEVLAGTEKGELVNVSAISSRKPSGATERDPTMLEPLRQVP
jgi:hypothetical protein